MSHTPVTGTAAPGALGAWPLIGHGLSLARRPLEFIRGLPQYGDVVQVRLGRLPAYVLTHPDLVHQVLVTEASSFSRGHLHDKNKNFLGEGLVVSSGQAHRRDRLMVQPAFKRARLAEHVPAIRSAAEAITSKWRPGEPVALDRDMADLALANVTSSLLGALSDDAAEKVRGAVPVLMKGGVLRSVTPGWFSRLPLPVNRRFQRAVTDVAAVVAELTARYRATGKPSAELLSTLALTTDSEGRSFYDSQIRDQVITFYMAGVETSSAALAWIFHEIGRNPDVEQRLYAELDAVLRGRLPDSGEIDRLPYTGRLITEVLRVYSVWFQMRRALRSVRLGNVELPAGAEVIYSPYLLHHDPRWFTDPERFDPDRWLPANAKDVHKHAFIPFAAGPHKCMGDYFAVLEYVIAIATICSRWRLRPLAGQQVRPVTHAVVHPNELIMIPERRK
jgi:cytochrome P450